MFNKISGTFDLVILFKFFLQPRSQGKREKPWERGCFFGWVGVGWGVPILK